MQDVNNQHLLRGKIKSLAEHKSFTEGLNRAEFILFGDNLLECFTLLNPAIEQEDIWNFQYVVYEPIDQPIYVFKTYNGQIISIKACGVYTNWPLPAKVSELIYRYDLPDFVLYNLTNDKIALAGEITETASVGNSQWQRELRKIAAAELGVPFIYQTVYSGKDDSLDTIREPSSLLAYNAFLYSIRYQVSSLVFFIEPNIETSRTRQRADALSPNVISRLFSAYVLDEIGDNSSLYREIEAEIYKSMAGYLGEVKYSGASGTKQQPRLLLDLPCINPMVQSALLTDTETFIDELTEFLHNPKVKKTEFQKRYDFSDLDVSKMKKWTDKQNMVYIRDLFNFLEENHLPPAVAPLSKFAAGIVDSNSVVRFLSEKNYKVSKKALESLLKFKETAIVPIYFHKTSNGNLQFTKDPYAGNTAAFSELLGFDAAGNPKRSVLAYCVSTNPPAFDIHTKNETNIYRSVAKYSDVLVMDTKEVISEFKSPVKMHKTYSIDSIFNVTPLNTTEDMGVISTYLQMGVIGSDWDVCMIAIHHSSWQQIRIRDSDNFLDTAKIGRNDSKVDLVMQSPDNLFFVAEGKRKYTDFFSSPAERNKIESAFNNIRIVIDDLYKAKVNGKIISFICILDVPEVDSDYFLEAEKKKIIGSISAGHLDKLANQDFVVIGAYTLAGISNFALFFSEKFPSELRSRLDEIFSK
jgi:hypothetical protein